MHRENIPLKRVWRGRFVRYAPLFIWAGVIFFLSSGQGSSTHTSIFIRPLLEFLFPAASETTLDLYHGYIRKFAHFAEYAALGMLASRAFWYSSKPVLRGLWPLWAIFVVLSIASVDEYNQSFDPMRTGSVFDVLIDLSGGAFAVITYVLIKRRS